MSFGGNSGAFVYVCVWGRGNMMINTSQYTHHTHGAQFMLFNEHTHTHPLSSQTVPPNAMPTSNTRDLPQSQYFARTPKPAVSHIRRKFARLRRSLGVGASAVPDC